MRKNYKSLKHALENIIYDNLSDLHILYSLSTCLWSGTNSLDMLDLYILYSLSTKNPCQMVLKLLKSCFLLTMVNLKSGSLMIKFVGDLR